MSSIANHTGDSVRALLLVPVFEDEFVEVGVLLRGIHSGLIAGVDITKLIKQILE